MRRGKDRRFHNIAGEAAAERILVASLAWQEPRPPDSRLETAAKNPRLIVVRGLRQKDAIVKRVRPR